MADKISGLPGNVDLSRTGSHSVKSLRQDLNAPTANTGSGTDDVTLTDGARRLQTLEARLATLPDVDRQRIDALTP